MSISVKNISVSIAGTKSAEFDIELGGILYPQDNFTLSQGSWTTLPYRKGCWRRIR